MIDFYVRPPLQTFGKDENGGMNPKVLQAAKL